MDKTGAKGTTTIVGTTPHFFLMAETSKAGKRTGAISGSTRRTLNFLLSMGPSALKHHTWGGLIADAARRRLMLNGTETIQWQDDNHMIFCGSTFSAI